MTRANPSSSSDDDSHDDEDGDDANNSFMRSTVDDDDKLTSTWLTARSQATLDFKNKNKSALKKVGRSNGSMGGSDGSLKRSLADRALEVLEESEGKKRKKR